MSLLAVNGSWKSPAFGGGGQAIEYALKTREFGKDALLTTAMDLPRC
jgi:hypothetical protein